MNATAPAEPTEPGEEEAANGIVQTASVDAEHVVAYATYGDPEGTPLLFFHGTPGSRHLGKLFDEVAADSGVRVLAPDRPGYGKSTAWPDRTLRDTGALVEAVLDDAGVNRAAVVGFSGGGPHALAAAATRPDRVASVDLVSGSTPPSLSRETPRLQRWLGGLGERAPRVLGALFALQRRLAERRPPSFVVDQYTNDGNAVPAEAAAVVERDFLAALDSGATGTAREFGIISADWAGLACSVTVAVEVWHGTADANVPLVDAERLVEHVPDASLQVLDGEDHLSTLVAAVPSITERRADATPSRT